MKINLRKLYKLKSNTQFYHVIVLKTSQVYIDRVVQKATSCL